VPNLGVRLTNPIRYAVPQRLRSQLILLSNRYLWMGNCMLHRLGSAAFLVLALYSFDALGQGSVGSRLYSLPVNATLVPACNAGQEGMIACFAGRQCVCYFERGGTMTGRRDGYRWNCGLLRPSCVEAPVETAHPSPPISVFPPAITLEPGGAGVAPRTHGLGERSWR
jgi:hypothetical protein